MRVEGHITRNLNQAFWVSLDALYLYGGETTTDGVKGGNTQRAFFLGGTFNVALSRSASLKLSYGEVVSRNDSGPDGWGFRAIASFAF